MLEIPACKLLKILYETQVSPGCGGKVLTLLKKRTGKLEKMDCLFPTQVLTRLRKGAERFQHESILWSNRSVGWKVNSIQRGLHLPHRQMP